ncbi:aminoacyl-tRNA synthetase, class Ic, partial [Kipferlia bialata]
DNKKRAKKKQPLKPRLQKPVIISHGMLKGLKGGDVKMSKSDPNSAVFVDDADKDVARKIKKAFCEFGNADNNPVLDYATRIIMPWAGPLLVHRSEEEGGDITYTETEALIQDFKEEKVHPKDLKAAVATGLGSLLQCVRDYFDNDTNGSKAVQEAVLKARVTR